MTDLHTKYVGLWESPDGLLCGKLSPGDLALIVDEHDSVQGESDETLIISRFKMAMLLVHTGQVGWVNYLSLRSL
jgi:hypothetical protein